MQRLVVLLIVGLLGWYGYRHYQQDRVQALSQPSEAVRSAAPLPLHTAPATVSPAAPQYRCDGRIHCSQMTSCEEATYFLRNCPGVKMDGNNDGIPCEQQWCKR
jgi:hypothetical protein